MVFILAVKSRPLYVAGQQIKSNNMLRSTPVKSTVKALSSFKPNRQANMKNQNKGFRTRNVALVSGIIIAGSYVSLSQSNYYNLDTLPHGSNGSSSLNGIKSGSVYSLDPYSHNPIKNDGRYFSTFTNSMQNNGIGNYQNKDNIFLFSDEQINQKLRRFEESYLLNRGKGVSRYDICQLASNSPIEDDRAEEIVQVPIIQDNNIRTSTDWMFFGIFDGHSGWNTSSKLRDQLIGYVIHELSTIYKPAKEENLRYVPNSITIDQAIKNGFLKLDHDIVHKNMERLLTENNKGRAAELLTPALSGSCALLSFYDSNSKLLKVAVTGDSRAILGSYRDNKWTVKQLSVDQTGSNPNEVARIISEHPNEANVVRNGRVLGSLEPTRAFGDCRYKVPASIQERIYKQFFGKLLPQNLKTPPYVTAEPVVSTTKVSPENNDFLVMASDGLYEMLSNEEIVGLVVKWMENEKMVKPQKSLWNFLGSPENKLPEVFDITNDRVSKKPVRKNKAASVSGSFLLEDKNVSTHLIRNALLNGGSKDQISMLLSIPSPISRRYRDDLTVTVVFFGSGKEGANENGVLEINPDATSGGIDSSKPKL